MFKALLETSLPKSRKWRCLVEAGTAVFSSRQPEILTSTSVPALGKRLCVFAHFDSLNRVDPYVFHHIKALHAMGMDVVFVSTSNLQAPDRDALLTICHKVILRKNLGYDFGSYRAGLMEMADLHPYEQFVLINDSVYGPLHDLKTMFDEMALRPADIWSITDSYEHEYHLQSYFLAFNQKTWQHPLVRNFWKNFWHIKNKRGVIQLYEIGLSRLAKQANLKLEAWCDSAKIIEAVLKKENARMTAGLKESDSIDEIEKRRLTQLLDVSLGRHCNISHFYWDYLVRDFRCPYIKVQLLRDNPVGVPNTTFYRDLLNSSYPDELISNHLRSNIR